MILDSDQGSIRHLSYCTNVHPGESVAEIQQDLDRHAVALKSRFRAGALGLGLRFGDQAIRELEEDPRAFERFAAFLDRSGLYAFSFNVFPQGVFHAPAVKERVYLPDWTTDERASYTLRAARILARLLPPRDRVGSLSTSPIAWAAAVPDPAATRREAARRLVLLAGDLARLEAATGIRIQVGLEPEPGCLLSTTAETIRFFEEDLWPAALPAPAVGGLAGPDQARRHVGVCLDACHLAVEYEEPVYSLEALIRAGIAIPKIQISCALELQRPQDNPEGVRQLAAHAEPRFLHQVTARDDHGRLHRFPDLSPFLDWLAGTPLRIDSARCHFHVPIHRPPVFPLHTTQPQLKDLLERQRIRREVSHLEVETYSFDLLPQGSSLRGSLTDDLEQEIRFARDLLTAGAARGLRA